MIKTLKESIETQVLLATKFKYHPDALFMYTINVNEQFYFGVEEYDFELSGYQIRKIEDLENFDIINNFSSQINEFEGLKEQIIHYPIPLISYYEIFKYLEKYETIISIEREYYDDDYFFLIGEIVKVEEDEVWFRDFDVHGKWNEEINIIPFDTITTIRFNSKYINTWKKYIK